MKASSSSSSSSSPESDSGISSSVSGTGKKEEEVESAVVVGHCCESGDLLSPAPGDPDTLAERQMAKAAIGDLLVRVLAPCFFFCFCFFLSYAHNITSYDSEVHSHLTLSIFFLQLFKRL